MTNMLVKDIVLDSEIFPRDSLDQEAIVRYRDAYEMGETLPPLVVEKGTGRLLDGWHRHSALTELEIEDVAIEAHVIPEGTPALLYAAALSSRHGVVLSAGDKREVAKRVFASDMDIDPEAIAHQLAVHRTTVTRWLEPLLEEAKERAKWDLEVRRGAAWLMTACGWTQQATGDWFGVTHQAISSDVQMHEACKARLLSDSAYVSAVLAVLPPELLVPARDVINEAASLEAEKHAANKAKAVLRDAWREVEHATGAIAHWLKDFDGIVPEDTTDERITHITNVLNSAVGALMEEDE